MAFYMGIAMPTAYNIFRYLRVYCEQNDECEEKIDNRRIILVYKQKAKQEQDDEVDRILNAKPEDRQ